MAARHRARHPQIQRRLIGPDAPGDAHVDVEAHEMQPRPLLQHGEEEQRPVGVDPRRRPPGEPERGVGDEGLHLEQQRPRSLHRADDDRSGRVGGALREKQRRGVRHLHEPPPAHLEDADLVRGAKPVLGDPEKPVRVVALPLEVEHRVDHVLEDARSRDRPFLGHVPDHQHRGASVRLGDAQQVAGALPDLADGPGGGRQVGTVHRLDGVDDEEAGADVLHLRFDLLEVGLRQHEEARGIHPQS